MTFRPLVGAFFYAWYNERRWEIPKVKNVPQIGYYQSDDPAVVEWQLSHVKESGCDFIAVQFMHLSDWGAEQTVKSIDSILDCAERIGLKVTFLLDVKVGPDNRVHDKVLDQSNLYIEMLRFISEKNWLRLIPFDKNGKALLFFFSPHDNEMLFLHEAFDQYRFLFPTYLPAHRWQEPFWTFNPQINKEGYEKRFPGIMNESLSQAGKRLGLFPFWSESSNSFAQNGVISLIPGYDDELLFRDNAIAPIIPRNGTNTFIEQIQLAYTKQSEIIMIYSWNEYFEDTAIEPTVRYGNRMGLALADALRLWPQSDFKQKSDALRSLHLPKAAVTRLSTVSDATPYGIPVWRNRQFNASIELIHVEIMHSTFAVLVAVKNTGTEPWADIGQISLGARAISVQSGEIVGDVRLAQLSNQTVQPGESVLVAGSKAMFFPSSPGTQINVAIDVVWEHRFWFEDMGSVPLVVKIDFDDLQPRAALVL